MAITVREMDVFRCVMQSGSVTNAAVTMNISQPAVSRMLQQAEERLGFRLFEREKKRLKPTTEAQTLFAEVVNVFAAIEHTQRLAVELRDGQAGLLTVAIVTGFGHTIVPQAVQGFRARPMPVGVDVKSVDGARLLRGEHSLAGRIVSRQASIVKLFQILRPLLAADQNEACNRPVSSANLTAAEGQAIYGRNRPCAPALFRPTSSS